MAKPGRKRTKKGESERSVEYSKNARLRIRSTGGERRVAGRSTGWRGVRARGCIRVWIDGGVGQRPESTKPMLEIMHTPSSRRSAPRRAAPRRARKNRNMAVASHALFALLFCTPTIPRTIDWRIIPVGARVPSLSCNIPLAARRGAARRGAFVRRKFRGESAMETFEKLTARPALLIA